MPPRLCQLCHTSRALVKRPKTGQQVCKTCFFHLFETEVHNTITTGGNDGGPIFKRGEKVAIGASGGKDSTVLAHVMTVLNERYDYGLELFLLSIDEGITGYRDDSLETVKQNQREYSLPLLILSYSTLYGYTMDKIVSQIGRKNNCTFCGVFRRQALDRGAGQLGVGHIVTGHNADDIAETVLMNIMRGDIARLSRCTLLVTQGEDTIRRSKPFKYAYEKEIVMYAYFKKLTYFSTECIYSPDAYRGHARVFLKDLEAIRPSAIIDIIHSGESFQVEESVVKGMKAIQTCLRCGYISSNDLCKACALLEGLEHGLDRSALKRSQAGGATTTEGHRTIAFYERPSDRIPSTSTEPITPITHKDGVETLINGIEHTHVLPPPRNPDEKFLLSITADPPGSGEEIEIILEEWQESLRQLQALVSIVAMPYLGRWYGRKWSFWAYGRLGPFGLTRKLFG